MKALLKEFMDLKLDSKLTNNEDILVYNEISLQLELGLYLRQNGYAVRFERNIGDYVNEVHGFVKKEIDIVVYKKGDDEFKAEKIAIELKFPRNGQYPEQMFSFIKDIKFMEQVKKVNGFAKTYVLTLVDDRNFYEEGNRGKKDIYSYFRGNLEIPNGKDIEKPTGKKEDVKIIKLNNSYKVKWEEPSASWLDKNNTNIDQYRYYIIECK